MDNAMHSTALRTFCALVAVSAFVVPALAAAQAHAQQADVTPEAEEEARIHFELAERYYRDGRFSSAADEFQTSYELSGRTELLYNAFLAHREASEFAEAAAALEAYLPTVSEGSRRQQLEVRLEQTRGLRDREAAQDSPPEIEPPDEQGETTGEEVNEPASGADESSASVVPWILLGTGAAMVVAGAVTGALTLSAQSERDELCEDNLCTGDFESVQERGRMLALTTDILLFGGVAVAAGGLLWLLLDKDPPVQPAASCSADGCAATVTGSF